MKKSCPGMASRSMIFASVLAVLLLLPACGGDHPREVGKVTMTLDRFGGDISMRFDSSGRFRTEKRDGQWWLVTPEGHAFFSHGVQGVSSSGTGDKNGSLPYRDNILKRHGSVQAWRENTLQLLRQAGQNTVGDFSEEALFRGSYPYVTGMHITPLAGEIAGAPRGFRGAARDFFDPAFEARVVEYADKLSPCAADPVDRAC